MRRLVLLGGVFGCILGIIPGVLAIAVDDYDVATNLPSNASYNLSLDSIYNYKRSSAVAVDHYWLLTAAHVGDDVNSWSNLTINGETYVEQEVVLHDEADLALVRYDKPFPGYYALMEGEVYHQEGSGRFKTTVWHELIMVGFGYAGTVSSSSFTQGGTQWIKRWGTNRGESEDTLHRDVLGTAGLRSSSCFHVDFDLSDTDYEAGANVYDSGGPVFATNATGWVLAGINAYRSGTEPNWTGNDAVKIADYVGWIKSVITDYDTDMDGLPDWWETEYGGNATSMDRDGHLDSDGYSNYEEWLADTVPTNAASFLEILDSSTETNLMFSSSTNRKYQVEYQTNLADTNEECAVEVLWFNGASPQTEQAVTATTSNRFYHIRAKLR